MTKSNWIRASILLASGATMMAWGCTNGWGWWWPVSLIATGVASYIVGGLSNPA